MSIKTEFKTRTILGMSDCTAETGLSIYGWKTNNRDNFLKFLKKSINMFMSDKYTNVNVTLYYEDDNLNTWRFALIDSTPFMYNTGVYRLYTYDISYLGTDVVDIARNKVLKAIIDKIDKDIKEMDTVA